MSDGAGSREMPGQLAKRKRRKSQAMPNGVHISTVPKLERKFEIDNNERGAGAHVVRCAVAARRGSGGAAGGVECGCAAGSGGGAGGHVVRGAVAARGGGGGAAGGLKGKRKKVCELYIYTFRVSAHDRFHRGH